MITVFALTCFVAVGGNEFGQGFTQGRYHFAVDGALYPRWESLCISY
jgi:hypothetical protein